MRSSKAILEYQKKSTSNSSISFRKSSFCAGIIYSIIFSLFPLTATAQENSEWPQFHGPDRTNKSTETGFLKQWPASGPELSWTADGLGDGFSTVSIAEGYLFTAGRTGKQTYVFAFDMNGRQIWKQPNGKPVQTTRSFAKSYIGSRSTPTYDNGIVYHLDEMFQLTAFDYKTGEVKWFLDLREFFDAQEPTWGYSESVFIEGDRLYCFPGGKNGFAACLNKMDGTLIWATGDIPGIAGHSTPIIVDFGGFRQLINMSSNSVYGIDTKTGRLLWNSKFENKVSINITSPVFHNGHVFVSSGYAIGCKLLKLNVSGNVITPETVWSSELMDNHHGGVILHEGYLYGSGDKARGWFCLDFMTGKEMWKARGKGSVLYADNMLYCLEEKGTMKLIRATPDAYDEVSSFKVPEGGEGMHWAHPVVYDGRLYIRHADKLFAYDISDLQAGN